MKVGWYFTRLVKRVKTCKHCERRKRALKQAIKQLREKLSDI